MSPERARRLNDEAIVAIGRCAQVAASRVRPDLLPIRADFGDLRAILVANGFNPRSSAYQDAIPQVG